jgi:putative ABC transport system permease protein
VYTLLARIVAMQRSQIALLKAFGYGNGRIAAHFVEFAVLIVTLGLLLGVALGGYFGRGLIGVYQAYFHFPLLRFRMPVSVTLWACLIALVSGLFGSLVAVNRAVKLPPGEAMRPEAPRSYRAGVLESAGIAQWLGTAGRVIVRNLARRPWRSAMSVVGIAAAVATVVLGRFTFDAVNALMSVHFDAAQREDIMVSFVEARSRSALSALEQMPGVLRVEGYRAVPVWLRAGHRQKRSTLLGVSLDQDLRQLVDARRQRIGMPPAGLVLTRKLASLLGVRAGDSLEVEQLDGHRLIFFERIVRLSDEPLGVSAYMEASALARILGEDGEVSGALLEVDRTREQALYDALKRAPAVTGVAVRSAMLQNVAEIMNRSFILMTFVMTGFAMVLVIGVVYNSARIALSERGNELASLRVLGFNRLEVAGLLLGEQAVLTVAAIPLGLALGALFCRLLVPVFDRELFRLPFVLSSATFGFASLVTLASAILSSGLIAHRIARLDLIAVLKSRE